MRRRIFVLLASFALFGIISAATAQARNFPQPQGLVNDFAGILSAETRQKLENQLDKLEKESSVEIAVVTVESLQKSTIDDYAVRLFEEWQIGKKDQDNGILLLIAPNERKLRIEVGYGLEPKLTDSQAGRIIRQIITPEFKKGDYDAGVTNGVAAIIKAVHGEGVGGEPMPPSEKTDSGGIWALAVIGVIFLSYLASFLARSKRFWPGGLLGALLGGVLGTVLASVLAALLLALGLGILGLLFDYILSKNYKKRQDKGLPTNWWPSGGGFFGGGSGGGFGGFGGGSSGGGGASGGW